MALALTLAPPASGDEGPRPDDPQRMLLGLVVDQRELSATEVYFDGEEFLLPLDDFLAICSCQHIDDGGRITIETRLGNIVLEPTDVVIIEGLAYLRERAMVNRLAMRIEYSPSRLALILDIPWTERQLGSARGNVGAATAEVRAPRLALSTAQIRVRRSQRKDLGVSSADTVMSGCAAGGQWRIRYDESFAERRRLSEYAWLRRFDDKLLMAGYQRVSLHPLLSGLEMTGVQGAWTNQPFELFTLNANGTELLPRQMRSTATISGVGVPAGTAVLRVNDRNVAAQTMGLDGLYDFREVRLSTSRANRVEVLIYDRGGPTVPIDIHDHSRSASQQMLPAGAVMAQGGFGQPGNALHPSQQLPGTSGFVQGRYGVSSRLTLETALQQDGSHRELVVGGVSQLASGVVASFAGANSGGRFGYLGDIEAYAGRWRFLASSQARQAGFQLGSEQFVDHFIDVTRRSVGGTWEAGLIGRYRRSKTGDQTFLLPAVSFRPWRGMSMRARPDYHGSYRFDLMWSPGSRLRVGATRSGENAMVDLSWQPSTRLRVSLLAQDVPRAGHSQALRLSWTGSGRWQPAVIVGPMLTNGRPGVALGLQAAVTPGMLLAATYQSTSLLAEEGRESGATLSLALVGNLAFAGSRIVPGRSLGNYGASGGIAGRIRVADGYKVDADQLAGLVILVNGRPAGRTTRGGKYLLTNLDEGVYRIEYDPDRLPIELSPRERKRLVEVAVGAITRADFTLDVEFGIAGRVLVDGQKLPGLLLELVDHTNNVVASGVTDRFGLFRIDSVPIGSYTLRLSPQNAPELDVEWPSRPVTVIDDFLFDPDLSLEVPAGAEGVIAMYEATATKAGTDTALSVATPRSAPSSTARRLFALLAEPFALSPTRPASGPGLHAVATAEAPSVRLLPQPAPVAHAVRPLQPRYLRSKPAPGRASAIADPVSMAVHETVTARSPEMPHGVRLGVPFAERVAGLRPRLYEYVTVTAPPQIRWSDKRTVVLRATPARQLYTGPLPAMHLARSHRR